MPKGSSNHSSLFRKASLLIAVLGAVLSNEGSAANAALIKLDCADLAVKRAGDDPSREFRAYLYRTPASTEICSSDNPGGVLPAMMAAVHVGKEIKPFFGMPVVGIRNTNTGECAMAPDAGNLPFMRKFCQGSNDQTVAGRPHSSHLEL